LEHLIHGWFNSWYHVSWCKGNLLNLSMIVLRIFVQGHLSNRDQGVVRLRPDLSDVKYIVPVFCFVSFWHDLDMHSPRRMVSFGNVVKEILGSIIFLGACHLTCLFSQEVLDSLVGLEMILHIEGFSFSVDPFVSMRTVSIHMSITIRGASVSKQNGDLVQRFWAQAPEVKTHVRVFQVSLRVSLLGVDEFWELNRIFDEEHWSIVSNHVVNSLFSVELYRKTSWISFSI
jgi:hypothetical protein